MLEAMGGRVVVAQVSETSPLTISDHVDKADSIVIWARDADTYRSVVDYLRSAATLRADGKPIAAFGPSSEDDLRRHDWWAQSAAKSWR
jgi:hypothetical protein